MFSHSLYNVVHIVGIVFLIVGLAMTAAPGVARESDRGSRRFAAVFHGLGLFLVLLGGFGMLARIGIVQGTSWPGWVWVKMLVWGGLGVAIFLPRRFPATARPLLLLLPILGGLAAYMAIYKPI